LDIHRTVVRRLAWVGALWLGAVMGCAGADEGGGSSQEPDCLDEPADAECDSLYPDTSFPELFERTLEPTCADVACHSAERHQGGLVLADEETAYDNLLGPGSDGRLRVKPGDTQCGKLIVRLETAGESWSMPAGNHLMDTELCVIRNWIADGALREASAP
jgi:hypothetical protein